MIQTRDMTKTALRKKGGVVPYGVAKPRAAETIPPPTIFNDSPRMHLRETKIPEVLCWGYG